MLSKKSILLITLILSLILSILSYRYLNSKEIHYHAGFKVFKDNKQVSFSDFKYMYIKPCTDDKSHQKENTQLEKAHLHDNIGDVIHIEAKGAKWEDLFKNINYDIDYQNTKAYKNGEEIKDFQETFILPYDSLIIFIGKNDSKYLKYGVGKSYIEKVGSKSTTCGE